MKVEIKGEKEKDDIRVFELKQFGYDGIKLMCNGKNIAYFHGNGDASFYLNNLKDLGFDVDLNGQTGQ